MLTSIKPINIILLDTYILAIIYLAITWKYMNCSTNSNIWQLFYYILLLTRLAIDQMENNGYIKKSIYTALILLSSFGVLVAICTYELVTIYKNPQYFDDPEHKSACFQNRILLVSQCIFGYLICVKDVLFVLYQRSKKQEEENMIDKINQATASI